MATRHAEGLPRGYNGPDGSGGPRRGGQDGHRRRGGGDAGQVVGKAEGALEALCRFVRDGLVSVQDAAASAGADADEIRHAFAAEG